MEHHDGVGLGTLMLVLLWFVEADRNMDQMVELR